MNKQKLLQQLIKYKISPDEIDYDFEKVKSHYYEKLYRKVSYSKLAHKSLMHMHKQIEKRCPTTEKTNILEVGGGSGEHLSVVPPIYSTYILTDLYPPIDNFYLEKYKNENLVFKIADAVNLPFSDETFDHVIYTCVLAHIPNLQLALKEARRVTKKGGSIVFYLPCDPGFFYRTARFAIPRFIAKKHEAQEIKDFCDSLDHVNSFLNMFYQLNWFFRNDEIRKYRGPIPISKLWWQLQAYEINVIKKSIEI